MADKKPRKIAPHRLAGVRKPRAKSKKARPKFTKRVRAKKRRALKRELGMTRRDVDLLTSRPRADWPALYVEALARAGL